ncbi:lim domain-containing protein wlim2a [Quercus suber]|uniref:Lim domain-containing protein wlim2a n=1 Tax=Quercus suber TaxID=58331 RepID=A0AAW0L2V1_QUESU
MKELEFCLPLFLLNIRLLFGKGISEQEAILKLIHRLDWLYIKYLERRVRSKAMAMSFTGTQQKCKVCEKTVYPVEQLSADGLYHKSCFKCSHCKGTLKLSNYSSMEGVLYCKPHFEAALQGDGRRGCFEEERMGILKIKEFVRFNKYVDKDYLLPS